MDSKLRPGETSWLGIFLLAELFAVLLRLGIHKSFASGANDVVVVQQRDESLKSMATHYQNGYSLPKGPVLLSPNTFFKALMDAFSNASPVEDRYN